ncbi:MAG: hypothetical protein WDN31_02330 [Hyphomicrobium sp.]
MLASQIADFKDISLNAVEESEDGPAYEIPVPITYYSARDGFRYGLYTSSAPILSISGSNSKHWNLGTISHEMAHRIISPKSNIFSPS